MRYAISWIAVWLSIATAFGQGHANPVSQSPDTASSRDADTQSIQQIETDWLKAEGTTDPSVVDRVLADDLVNLTPTGIGPGKAEILRNFRSTRANLRLIRYDSRICTFSSSTRPRRLPRT
jgi:hypothetical protein